MSFIGSLAAMGTSLAAGGLGALGVSTAAGTLGAGIASGIGAAGAGALTGAALGAGGAALTGGDVGEAAGMGALTGAVTGGLSSGLSSAGAAADAANAVNASTTSSGVTAGPISGVDKAFAGLSSPASQVQTVASPMNISQATTPSMGSALVSNASPTVNNLGMLGEAGQAWNALTPGQQMLGQGVAGLGVSSVLDSAMAPDMAIPERQKLNNRFSYNKQFNYAPSYATGGITDLDTYMSNAQNIPNPREVADPEGYGSNSVQMMAEGGIADLGGYAAGGIPNLLRGVGDGVSDDIPATIAGKQPARLAAGEYVVSSRIVSELGNGSTEAGAKRLDDMVKRIQAGRSKTIGKGKEYAKDTKPYKHLPA